MLRFKSQYLDRFATNMLYEDQIVREETGTTNQPITKKRHLKFDKRIFMIAIAAVIALEFLIPGFWPLTSAIAGLIILNNILDIL